MRKLSIITPPQWLTVAACTLMMSGAMLTTSCKDEVLTGQPEWLGNSIYDRLAEEGNYTTVMKLIDDLGQHEVLAHTGSKTLFAADDSAYGVWFRNNAWGVRNYDQLSLAQKKLLLKNAMINNAYLIELMANEKAKSANSTPLEGRSMRRETAVSIYDSVYIMQPSEFPQVESWDELRKRNKPIPILCDITEPPMIHFLPAFMSYNKITDEDLAILTNQQAKSTAEAWVNGKRVSERDITCKNGYIQKVDGVVESAQNMARIMHQHPNMSLYTRLLDRFSVPVPDVDEKGGFGSFSSEYNRLYNREDTVYVLAYYANRFANNRILSDAQKNNESGGQLIFDPGWNQYVDSKLDITLHNDAGVMIVPSNEAMDRFWNNEGRALQEEFGTWDNVNMKVLSVLVRNHQLSSITAAVPSKFHTVLNDAFEPLGITKEDIDSCFVGCNGVVYLTNKVFMPVEFVSVLSPASFHNQTMSIIYWALTGAENYYNIVYKDNGYIDHVETYPFNFKPYLLSMSSRYALMLPTNEALQTYIDPATYGGESMRIGEEGDTTTLKQVNAISWEYDTSKPQNQWVQGKPRPVVVDEDGSLTPASTTAQRALNSDKVSNIYENLINQLIIVIPDSMKQKTIDDYLNEGYPYFVTKGGSMVRVSRGENGKLAFEGGWQMDGNGRPVEVSEVYNEDNGVSYQLEETLPLPTMKSLLMVLKSHDEYSAFLHLANNDLTTLFSNKISYGSKDDEKFVAGNTKQNNYNFSLFDNYNYTVYVPSTGSIEKMQEDGLLPSFDAVDAAWNLKKEDDFDSLLIAERLTTSNFSELSANDLTKYRKRAKELVQNLLRDFVRYHVQDHSVAIGLASDRNRGEFETMKRNPISKRFYTLKVNFDNQQITVIDETGKDHHVTTTPGLYNNVVREYWFKGNLQTRPAEALQKMVSDAVVHLIDSPLQYEEMRPWREVVLETLEAEFKK